jgi:hypothetical protein
MQLRRRSVWLVVAVLGFFAFGLWYGNASDFLTGFYTDRPFYSTARLINGRLWVPPSTTIAVLEWTMLLTLLLPIAVGVLLADRLPRDRRTRVEEVFQSLPGEIGERLFGKYLGATLGTLVPIFVLYLGVVAYMLTQRFEGHALAMALVAFVVGFLPGALFVAGFSVVVPAVMPVPLYQFLFIGYWFWGNMLGPKVGIPTISDTLLNATGMWDSAIVHFQPPFASLSVTPTIAQGIANIAILLGLGALALYAGVRYQRWQLAQQ